MTDQVKRLESCPDHECNPLERQEFSCYGMNGTHRACVLQDGCRLLTFKGTNAWSGPADLLKKEAEELKKERQKLQT